MRIPNFSRESLAYGEGEKEATRTIRHTLPNKVKTKRSFN